MEEATEYYQDLMRSVFAGRRFLITGPVAVGIGTLGTQLVGLGAERPLLIAGSRGTGDLPTPEQAELHILGLSGKDILEEHRNLQLALHELPQEVQRAVDAWDADGVARTISASPLGESRPVAGRPQYAARPTEWAALEDKVRIDAFWDDAGVERAPSRIVPVDYQAIRSTARTLDRGLGTVWAADARDGTHGGGLGLRWVRPGTDGRESFASLSRMADRVRVMPFLEGIPVSIHGIVFPGAVAVFRPVEMIVLRPPEGDRLFYAGCATAFDPRPEDREIMRRLAYRVGAALRESVGYRGPFGIDGVLAAEGFLPTELNARAGAGFKPLQAGTQGLPLGLLCTATIEGERLDYRADLLERAVVDSSDAHRTCAGWAATSRKFDHNGKLELVRDGAAYRERLPDETAQASIAFGPGAIGGFIRFQVSPDQVEPGPSAAPEVVRALRFVDDALETGFGPLAAARNVRP